MYYFYVCLLLVIILSCILAILLIKESPGTILAGAEKIKVSNRKKKILQSSNIIVDTLNLTHWLNRRDPKKKINICDIISAINITAPLLKNEYTGRIIYVTKDRETQVEKDESVSLRKIYQTAAHTNNVYINVVERLPEEVREVKMNKSHASLGRDDFYLIMLAWNLHCPVLSRDRFHDLSDMKTGHLDKFHVYIYSPVKYLPERDYVNPAAAEFSRMQRPIIIDYSTVFAHL